MKEILTSETLCEWLLLFLPLDKPAARVPGALRIEIHCADVKEGEGMSGEYTGYPNSVV